VSQTHTIEFFNRGDREGQLLNFQIRAEQIPEMTIGFSRMTFVQLPIEIKPRAYQIFEYNVDFTKKLGFQRPGRIDVTVTVDFQVSAKAGREPRSGSFRIRTLQ
jgi:hypothetical protein